MSVAPVALVFVSHSAQVAEGLVAIAEQMAPDVFIVAAGGIGEGRIGTSYERVESGALEALGVPGVDGVVMLTDLGSATLTAAAVLDGVEDSRLILAEGPFVEGAVAAAVAAQTGGDLAAVRAAVRGAGLEFARLAAERTRSAARPAEEGVPAPVALVPVSAGSAASVEGAVEADGAEIRTVVLRNRLGLHARPAALLARAVSVHNAEVTLNGVPARSVLELMALGLEGGVPLHLAAAGPDAQRALDAVEALINGGFGED
jgi:PTS hybrid protein